MWGLSHCWPGDGWGTVLAPPDHPFKQGDAATQGCTYAVTDAWQLWQNSNAESRSMGDTVAPTWPIQINRATLQLPCYHVQCGQTPCEKPSIMNFFNPRPLLQKLSTSGYSSQSSLAPSPYHSERATFAVGDNICWLFHLGWGHLPGIKVEMSFPAFSLLKLCSLRNFLQSDWHLTSTTRWTCSWPVDTLHK